MQYSTTTDAMCKWRNMQTKCNETQYAFFSVARFSLISKKRKLLPITEATESAHCGFKKKSGTKVVKQKLLRSDTCIGVPLT